MFYIQAPTGQVSLHVLENCVFARLDYLQLLYQSKAHEFNGNFEYLLENSLYDKIGHFTLRLLASVSTDLWDFWIKRETLLLKSRLNHLLPRQLHRLLRNILRQLRSLSDKEKSINRTIIDTCVFFLKPSVFKHLISKNHARDCEYFQTKVRFELVPDLIKKRKVDLHCGYAIVYCSKFNALLVSLFTSYITTEVTCTRLKALHVINHDMRLDYLYQKIHCRIFRKGYGYGRITINNIESEFKNFPLCMQNLHIKLRNTHRLSHYARLYYSLFLKDSGMHIEDAINYWKDEYSKPHSCKSVCLHNWQSNETKFVYSIRHLYGLEGSKKDYKSLHCEAIAMNVPGPKYEGGCPFKNFDTNALRNLLYLSLSNDQVNKLLNSRMSQNPQITCAKYFKILNQEHKDNIVINSPLQYYLSMINTALHAENLIYYIQFPKFTEIKSSSKHFPQLWM